MPSRSLAKCFGTLTLMLLAAPVHGQDQRPFVGAGFIANKDQTNSSLSNEALSTWTLVAGLEVSPHVAVRGVLEAAHELHTNGESTFVPFGSVFPVHLRYSQTRRTISYGVLGDLHGDISPRLRVAGLFGLMTVTHTQRMVVVREELRPDGTRLPLPDQHNDGDHPWVGFVFGVETPITLVNRLAIVPEVRVISFWLSDSPEPYIVRSGVGMRWRF